MDVLNKEKITKDVSITKDIVQAVFSMQAMILIPVAAFLLMECYSHNPFEEVYKQALWLNILLFELIAWFIFFISGRVRVALSFELILAMIYGLANTYVVRFRTNPLVPWDLFSARTAFSVASNYDMTPDAHMIKISCGFLFLIILVQFFKFRMPVLKLLADKKIKKGQVLSTYNGGVILARLIPSAMVLTLLLNFVSNLQDENFQNKNNLYPFLFTPAHMTKVNGMAVTFAMNLKYMSVDVPKDYDKEEVEELLATYEKKDSFVSGNAMEQDSIDIRASLPNIIVVMNEAFSDLASISDFETSEDPLPFLHQLQSGIENTITGHLQVSVCGGNTANSEFEFLTGNTMAFLPQGSIPYQQYIHGEIDALPSYLKSLGYETVATHPYISSGWERNTIYPQLGFDSSIFIGEYNNKEKLRSYISDDACANKIIELYERKAENTPLFVFNITMQNHGGYSDEYDNFVADITAEGIDNISVKQYLSLIKRSDEMLKKLVSYFAQVEEDTIIVFFGDHQPNDSVAGPILEAEGKNINKLSEEELLTRYEVPYVIWANYDIEEAIEADTSLNYLGMQVLKAAGIKLPVYQAYLSELEKEYPVISAMQVQKEDGTVTNASREEDGLRLYESIQYYQLFDAGE